MSHFRPDSNGRIVRVFLHDNKYLAYTPELLCRITKWHNLHGGACQHWRPDPSYSKWPCSYCCYYTHDDKSPAIKSALGKDSRKIAMVPGPGQRHRNLFDLPWCMRTGTSERSWNCPIAPGRKVRETRNEDIIPKKIFSLEKKGGPKKKQSYVAARPDSSSDLKFKFVNPRAGKDDPLKDGKDIAFAPDMVLPSDGLYLGVGNARYQSSDGSVRLGTAEEKELADLRKKGLLKDFGEQDKEGVTLEALAEQDERPVYTLRLVPSKKRRGGKGITNNTSHKAASQPTQGQETAVKTGPDTECGVENIDTKTSTPPLGEEEEKEDEGEEGTASPRPDSPVPAEEELLSPEAIEAMPDHCWADFLADIEAEGWVPVPLAVEVDGDKDDDLTSVAESWVVMQDGDEEEESDSGLEET